MLQQVAITCSNREKAPHWQEINRKQRGMSLRKVYTVDAHGLALQVGLSSSQSATLFPQMTCTPRGSGLCRLFFNAAVLEPGSNGLTALEFACRMTGST